VPLLARFFNVFRSQSLERDFDDEIRFHLEERTRRHVAERMSPHDAEATARRRFGSIERAKAGMREARVVRWSAGAALTCAVATVVLAGGSLVWRTRVRVYEVGGGVTAPVPVATPRPQYTEAARHAKIQGTVRVRCVIRLDGLCSDVTVVRSLDRTFGLDDEAVRTIREWRFQPARLQGTPVATRVMFDLGFHLR
jgi:TonB family protein